MIPAIEQFVPTQSWQDQLAGIETSAESLFNRLQLDKKQLNLVDLAPNFKLKAPLSYVSRIKKGDINDPLLKQILPLKNENNTVLGFVNDPLGENDKNPLPGVIHKYQSRLLVITTSHCAIHCRYCFRRQFEYNDNKFASKHWDNIVAYIKENPAIDEVILSGGDPLSLPTASLQQIAEKLASLSQIKRLRIHSRLPVVIPSRIDEEFIRFVKQSPIPVVMVVHINHAQEIDEQLKQTLLTLKQVCAALFNQAVLLKGINDNPDTLKALAEKLFDSGTVFYYLFLLDKVTGAHEFYLETDKALDIYHQLQAICSGFLVPKLAKEQAGQPHKTLLV